MLGHAGLNVTGPIHPPSRSNQSQSIKNCFQVLSLSLCIPFPFHPAPRKADGDPTVLPICLASINPHISHFSFSSRLLPFVQVASLCFLVLLLLGWSTSTITTNPSLPFTVSDCLLLYRRFLYGRVGYHQIFAKRQTHTHTHENGRPRVELIPPSSKRPQGDRQYLSQLHPTVLHRWIRACNGKPALSDFGFYSAALQLFLCLAAQTRQLFDRRAFPLSHCTPSARLHKPRRRNLLRR